VPHDRPAKAFWRDVETLLRDEGVLARPTLDAYALMHGFDPLMHASGVGVQRLRGFFVGPLAAYGLGHHFARRSIAGTQWSYLGDSLTNVSSQSFVQADTHSDKGGTWGAAAEYHRPFGVRTQLDASIAFQTDILHAPDRKDTYSTVVGRWWLGERWAAVASASHDRFILRAPFALDRWSLGFLAGRTSRTRSSCIGTT